MQIRKIVLYNQKGEMRSLLFRLGAVNIITGRSNRGKSALIEIVEYCLGHSSFRVPEGIIRDSVAWYGLILQIGETQIFIAKPAPQGAASSQSQVYYEIASEIEPPALEKLQPNTNDEGIADYLSGLIGIGANRHVPDLDESRLPLAANIKHTEFYLFQPQSTIANRDILFYRQQEPFIPQAIKDTLPYLLGVVQENRLQLETDLRNARRNLRLLHKQLQEAEQITGNNISQGQNLLVEAQQVGLISGQVNTENWDLALSALQSTINWQPSDGLAISNDELLNLQEQIQSLRQQFHTVHDEIKSTENYVRQTQGYEGEAFQQQLRLQAIGIIDSDVEEIERCPLCSSQISESIPKIAAIRRSLRGLENNVRIVQSKQPKLQERLDELSERREQIRLELSRTEAAISAIISEQEASQNIRDTSARIARVVGRISLFLENVRIIDDNAEIREQLEHQRRIVSSLEEALDSEELEERLTSILALINQQMGDWAQRLQLEHNGYPYRLDLKRLTVVADRPERPIPMSRMGGGENWLGCHLITLLSLHKHFVTQQRPVPRFIILDQPTQVYFPSSDVYKATQGLSEQELVEADADVVAVERMFNFLFDLCAELHPNFQIIVLEHANLNNKQFQDALVEPPWNHERALIPVDWLVADPNL